jgi:hypothetical protein
MSFNSGPITFRRFFFSGRIPNAPTDALLDALRQNAFGKSKSVTTDGAETGWIAPTHIFDADITPEKCVVDRFLHLNLRIDKTAPPASIVRAYTQLEEQAALKDKTKPFLSKADRKDAKDRALAKAQRESNAGLYRKIASHDVLIDLAAKTLYFSNLGSSAGDKLLSIFRETFDTPLEPATAESLAHRIAEAAGDHRAIEDAEPFHLVPSQANPADDNGFDFNDRSFFGREFLTWLWHTCETTDGALTANEHPLAVMMVNLLNLACDFGVTGTDTIRADAPTRSPEAKAALAIGKQPTKSGLILAARGDEYNLTFEGPRFTVSSLRLPDSEATDEPARNEERFTHIKRVAGLLDALYALYLGQRASHNWPKHLNKLKKWTQSQTPTTIATPAEHLIPNQESPTLRLAAGTP